MNNKVHGVIEGTDRDHHADGLMLRHRHAPGRGGIDTHRDLLAGVSTNTLDTVANAIDSAIDLDPRVDQGLAALVRRSQGQHIALFSH